MISLWEGYIPLIWKDSDMVLQFIWNKDIILHGTYLENSVDSYSTGIISLNVLLLFQLLITFFIFMLIFWCYFIYHRWGSLDQPIG